MKILFDHHLPFLLAHGGLQIQIEQTKAALESLGIEVEYLEFWDEKQRGDLIHFFGRGDEGYIKLAHQKGMAVVMSELLTGAGSRSKGQLLAQRSLIRLARKVLPKTFTSKMGWEAFQMADAVIALTAWEAELMVDLFAAEKSKLHVVPNGVDECFFPAPDKQNREDWLICAATITERKRVVELGAAAVAGGIKVKIAGRPYSEDDPYYQKFLALCREHPDYLEYLGPITERLKMARLYQSAGGFVLLSTMESLSLSALEAAASGCPLLLSDLPWARTTFGRGASYCPINLAAQETGKILKDFAANHLARPKALVPLRWAEVARQLVNIYTRCLSEKA